MMTLRPNGILTPDQITGDVPAQKALEDDAMLMTAKGKGRRTQVLKSWPNSCIVIMFTSID